MQKHPLGALTEGVILIRRSASYEGNISRALEGESAYVSVGKKSEFIYRDGKLNSVAALKLEGCVIAVRVGGAHSCVVVMVVGVELISFGDDGCRYRKTGRVVVLVPGFYARGKGNNKYSDDDNKNADDDKGNDCGHKTDH